jgi:hypothetical protein
MLGVSRILVLLVILILQYITGVIIYFDFTPFSKYTKESVMDRVASLLVETVRNDFGVSRILVLLVILILQYIVLTFSHAQLKFYFHESNRRNETGVIIYFDFTPFSKYTKESVMDRVASLLGCKPLLHFWL